MAKFRKERIFSRDDISIIDQLDIKSEPPKEDFLQMRYKPTHKTAKEIITERENIMPNSSSELEKR